MTHAPITERTTDQPDTVVETEQLIGATLIVGVISAVIALVLFNWLAREMLRGATADFDGLIRNTLNGLASDGLTRVMRYASRFGGPTWLSVAGVAVVLGFLVKRWYRGVVLVVVTFGGAWLLDVILKHTFERTRPEPFFGVPLPGSYSFPSGHALFAFVFFGTFAVLLVQRLKGHPVRILIWTVAGLLVALIGISRVHLGVHYPSDVIAGYLSALVWVVVVGVVDRMASHGVFKRWLLKRRKA